MDLAQDGGRGPSIDGFKILLELAHASFREFDQNPTRITCIPVTPHVTEILQLGHTA